MQKNIKFYINKFGKLLREKPGNIFNFYKLKTTINIILLIKTLISSASVLKNTNRIISSTSDRWNSLKSGSFFKFSEDSCVYSIAKTDILTITKEFRTISRSVIQITEDIEITLQKDDEITLLYFEFEMLTVARILDNGKNYKVGDIVFLSGGSVTFDTFDNTKNTASLTVKKVDDNGKILELGLKSRGRYYSAPPRYCNLFGGSGDGAQIDVEYKELDRRTKLTTRIRSIDYLKEYSRIFIDHNISEEIAGGILTCEKFELFLTQPYLGETRHGAGYQILHDFSSYLNLPLMSRNTFAVDIVFNRAVLMLEEKIKELDLKTIELEGKIKELLNLVPYQEPKS